MVDCILIKLGCVWNKMFQHTLFVHSVNEQTLRGDCAVRGKVVYTAHTARARKEPTSDSLFPNVKKGKE